ncbi:MAG: transcription factor S [Desulfurococcales archaeon]|nr:transcription factor S [Desulfurococcales archaeon]
MPAVGVRGGLRFCPRCGGILYPRVRGGVKQLFCPRCGYEENMMDPGDVYKMKTRVEHSPRERMIIVSDQDPPPTASIVKGEMRCPKCGHDELLFWMMQTRAADEPPTRFYRCRRCGYTWREYA